VRSATVKLSDAASQSWRAAARCPRHDRAAAVAGRFGAGKASYATRSLAAMAGILVLYLGGLTQLAVITGSLGLAAIMGVVPFVAADAVKALVAGALSGRRGSV